MNPSNEKQYGLLSNCDESIKFVIEDFSTALLNED